MYSLSLHCTVENSIHGWEILWEDMERESFPNKGSTWSGVRGGGAIYKREFGEWR